MRLKRLFIGNYQVLKDVEIEFDPKTSGEKYAIDFVVGLNGSGKSTLLQVIAHIILCLERGANPRFAYELEYEIDSDDGKKTFKITNVDFNNNERNALGPHRLIIGDEEKDIYHAQLPKFVVAFTTGEEECWKKESLIDPPGEDGRFLINEMKIKDRFIKESPGHVRQKTVEKSIDKKSKSEETTKYFLIQKSDIAALALCGLLEFYQKRNNEQNTGLNQVLEECEIEGDGLVGFSLKIRMNEGIISDDEKKEIERLRQHATRAIRSGADRLLVFDLKTKCSEKIDKIIDGNGFFFFQKLSSMQQRQNPAENALQQINIFLEKTPLKQEDIKNTNRCHEKPPLHLFDWLSDGEKSYFARMCLFQLMQGKEALIMLDEPEVHFNDYWKRQIVGTIDKLMKNENSHILIATHSSITLSDVPKEDIVVLQREGIHTNKANHPKIQTLAADPGDIMVHVFGAPYAMGDRSIDRISNVLNMTGSKRARKKGLEEIQKQVAPGYWSYKIHRASMALEKQSQ